MNKSILCIIFLLLFLAQPALAIPINWTLSNSNNYTSSEEDWPNTTYTKDWMFYLMVSNRSDPNWTFPVDGFMYDLTLPPVTAWSGMGVGSGHIFYFILYCLFIIIILRKSDATVAGAITVMVGGFWGMIFPEDIFPYAIVLIGTGLAALLYSWYVKED